MNQIKSGTIFVAIATFVTAILILNTNRDESITSKDKPIIASESNSSLSEENIETPVIIPETTASQDNNNDLQTNELQTAMNNISEAVEIKAPDGPFNKASSEINDDQSELTSANNDGNTSTQHDLLNHIIQPIWMDQKLGDFKSVETGEVIFNIMPTNPKGLQGEDPKGVITNKSDKFAPTAISSDYNYQQMPMYNGGYYIAPMPPYLMPSVLPQSTIIKN